MEALHEFIDFVGSLMTVGNFNQWTFVLLVLSLEMSLCCFVILPLPLSWRVAVLDALSKLWNQYPRFRIVTKTVMAIIFLLLVDSIRRMYLVHTFTEPENVSLKVSAAQDLAASLYEAERDGFLCGFTIFLFLMIYRFQQMSQRLESLEVKLRLYDPNLVNKTEGEVKSEYNLGTSSKFYVEELQATEMGPSGKEKEL